MSEPEPISRRLQELLPESEEQIAVKRGQGSVGRPGCPMDGARSVRGRLYMPGRQRESTTGRGVCVTNILYHFQYNLLCIFPETKSVGICFSLKQQSTFVTYCVFNSSFIDIFCYRGYQALASLDIH